VLIIIGDFFDQGRPSLRVDLANELLNSVRLPGTNGIP
jgi:hypothetical protein